MELSILCFLILYRFYTYVYFKKIGFTDKEIALVVDETKEHNEKAWREYFPLGINFWIND